VRTYKKIKQPEDLRVLERGAPKSKRDRLVGLEASIRIGGALKKNAVVPDALFGLRLNDTVENFFMLEIDRGEMPVERFKNTQRTYFAKKMLTYYQANRQQRHVHDLGIPNFRVLTLCACTAPVANDNASDTSHAPAATTTIDTPSI
jgi:hypothetical protein